MLLRLFERLAVWFVFSWLFLRPCIHAQQDPEPKAPQADATESHPNSTVGLSDFLNDMLTAARNDDRVALRSQIADTAFPNYRSWFVTVYGDKEGQTLADEYAKWRKLREDVFMELFLYLANQEGKIFVQHFNLAHIHPHPLVSYDAYIADWEWLGVMTGEKVDLFSYFFIFVDGKFRWDSTTQTHRETVEEPRCPHVPSPPYPREANGVQGFVLINALVNKDGSVTVLNVAKGDKILAQAAVETVRQWHCEPALVDGWRPIDRQIVFEINFKLSSPLH